MEDSYPLHKGSARTPPLSRPAQDADPGALSLRDLLCIPYRIEASTTEGTSGEWLRRAAYPELPDCMAEAPTIEEAVRRLERRRMEIIVATVRAGRLPPVPRPPLRGCDPAILAGELGLASLLEGDN